MEVDDGGVKDRWEVQFSMKVKGGQGLSDEVGGIWGREGDCGYVEGRHSHQAHHPKHRGGV